MPQTFVNTFSPLTPVGAGLQNLSMALFGGATPAEREAKMAQAQYALAHADQARANEAKARAETDSIRMAQTAQTNALPTFVRGLFPDNPTMAGPTLDFLANKQTEAPGPPEQTGAMPSMRVPMPEAFTPDLQAKVGRFNQVRGMADAGSGTTNAPQFMQALAGMQDSDFVDQARAGKVTPEQMLANAGANYGNRGSAPFHFGETAVGNNLSGVSAPTALGIAKGLTEGARQGELKAQANASNAHAGLFGAQKDDVVDNRKMVPALNPDGSVIPGVMVRQGDQGKAFVTGAQTRTTNAAKPQKGTQAKALNKTQSDMLNAAVSSLVGQGNDIDPATSAAVVSRATQLTTDPSSEYFQDPVGAAQAAAAEVAPQGFEKAGTFGFRKMAPVGGLKTGGKISTATVAGNLAGQPPVAPVRIVSDSDFAKLPSGAIFIAPDGSTRRKP